MPYINYDFQVDLPVNKLLKKISETDFESFYKENVAKILKSPKNFLAVWIKSRFSSQYNKKQVIIHFLDDTESIDPIAVFTPFACKDVEQLLYEVGDYKQYNAVLKDISVNWQNFLIDKLGVSYKKILAKYEMDRINKITSKKAFIKESENFNERFADVIDSINL